jgi:hypothetical protein
VPEIVRISGRQGAKVRGENAAGFPHSARRNVSVPFVPERFTPTAICKSGVEFSLIS